MERVRAAQSVLRQVVPESRLAGTDKLSTQGDGWVYLKLESEGPTGSFKVRGAYHAIHVRQKQLNGKLPGVVTSSTGNHGAAVAYAASRLHIPSRVYLPENPNTAKKARIADSGAEIVEAGKFLEETRQHAANFAEQSGWYNIVDGSDPEMLPGTATIACEILDKLTRADVILVPVGDSTLIRGVAFAAKQTPPRNQNRRGASRTRAGLRSVLRKRPRHVYRLQRHHCRRALRPRYYRRKRSRNCYAGR